jgi:hypothetical protein
MIVLQTVTFTPASRQAFASRANRALVSSIGKQSRLTPTIAILTLGALGSDAAIVVSFQLATAL